MSDTSEHTNGAWSRFGAYHSSTRSLQHAATTAVGTVLAVRPGDRLMDGSVSTITAQAVVLMQEVNDPLSLEKQREVRKFLRGEVK